MKKTMKTYAIVIVGENGLRLEIRTTGNSFEEATENANKIRLHLAACKLGIIAGIEIDSIQAVTPRI